MKPRRLPACPKRCGCVRGLPNRRCGLSWTLYSPWKCVRIAACLHCRNIRHTGWAPSASVLRRRLLVQAHPWNFHIFHTGVFQLWEWMLHLHIPLDPNRQSCSKKAIVPTPAQTAHVQLPTRKKQRLQVATPTDKSPHLRGNVAAPSNQTSCLPVLHRCPPVSESEVPLPRSFLWN